MIRYQGEDIDFQISLGYDSEIRTFSDIDDVTVYIYTGPSYIADFSLKKGNLKIVNNVLCGKITSKDTRSMMGYMMMDVLLSIHDTDGTKNDMICSKNTGIIIRRTPIKDRTYD